MCLSISWEIPLPRGRPWRHTKPRRYLRRKRQVFGKVCSEDRANKPLPESGAYLLEFAAAGRPCVANHCIFRCAPVVPVNRRPKRSAPYRQRKTTKKIRNVSLFTIYANQDRVMRQEEGNYITIRWYRPAENAFYRPIHRKFLTEKRENPRKTETTNRTVCQGARTHLGSPRGRVPPARAAPIPRAPRWSSRTGLRTKN
jgi:hypothetical protein